MPRPSRASLSVIYPNVSGRQPRLSAPDHLSEAERQVFVGIVSDCPGSHFRASDLPLLVEYVCAVVAAREAAAKMAATGGPVTTDGVNPWFTIHEKLSRRMAVLAMRLRLCPSSRSRPETVQRRSTGYQPSAYDMLDLEGDDDGR